MLRGYDLDAQQVWQVAKSLAVEENRSLTLADLWWGCLATLPQEEREKLNLVIAGEKQERLDRALNTRVEQRVSVSAAVTALDQKLKAQCQSTGAPVASVKLMLKMLLDSSDDELAETWKENGVDPAALREQMEKAAQPVEQAPRTEAVQLSKPASPPEEPQAPEASKPAPSRVSLTKEARHVLEMFTRNLTDAAARGELSPAYERDSERSAIVRTLLRKNKRNVALVGPAGVGKTKLVEDLAVRLVRGEIPQLTNCEVIALSATALRAGTTLHGEVEQRFEQLRKVLEDYGEQLILFIDEMHVIVGTALSSQSLDLANALKPVLAADKIRCIGATTQQEFIQYIERDRALARRFQMIAVSEPTRGAMERIFEAVRSDYERHHDVRYPPETLQAILDLGDVYMPNRYYPDKGLDLLDEAGAWVVMQEPGKAARKVSPDAVRAVLSEILLIPLEDLTAGSLPQVEETLEKGVIGQTGVLKLIHEALIGSGGRSAVSQRPRAAMVFMGPPGTGKTHTAEVLTEALCHKRQALLELDLDQIMRNYIHGNSADFLLGPRPPYVGWEHGGILTNHVLLYPQSVILVRGIERARADVQHIFAGILDRGEVEDGRGQRVPFRGVTFIFSVEGEAETTRPMGFLQGGSQEARALEDPLQMRDQLMQMGLLPDLLRHVSHVVPFQPLSVDSLREIARRRLDVFRRELDEREGKVLEVEEEFVTHLLSNQVHTAADVEQQIERLAVLPVNSLRSSSDWGKWKTIRLRWAGRQESEAYRPRLLLVSGRPEFYEELSGNYKEYDWSHATDVAAATRAIGRERPSLVLIDTESGEDGGIDKLKALRQRFPVLAMVLLAETGDFTTVREAFRLGAYDCLEKPLQEPSLGRLVDTLTSEEEQRRRLASQELNTPTQWERGVEVEESGVDITYR